MMKPALMYPPARYADGRMVDGFGNDISNEYYDKIGARANPEIIEKKPIIKRPTSTWWDRRTRWQKDLIVSGVAGTVTYIGKKILNNQG